MKNNFPATLMGLFLVLFLLLGINILVWADNTSLNIHAATSCLWMAGGLAVLYALLIAVDRWVRN